MIIRNKKLEISKITVYKKRYDLFIMLVYPDVQVDVQLDWLKHKGTKRAQFLLNKTSKHTSNITVLLTNEPNCQQLEAFVIVRD